MCRVGGVTVGTSISPSEKARLERVARLVGASSVSAYIRLAIHQAIGQDLLRLYENERPAKKS